MATDQHGDPDGRRRARDRALKLGEANHVADVLRALATDARFPVDVLAEWQARLATLERIEWQRADGRVDSRRKHSLRAASTTADPALVNLLFIDESGVAWPKPGKQNDVLALGAIALSQEVADEYCEVIRELKLVHFGHANAVLHEPAVRKHDGLFYFGGDQGAQDAFHHDYVKVLNGLDFVVFGSAVRKASLTGPILLKSADHYFPSDTYGIAIHLLMERYTDYIATRPDRTVGKIFFEAQGPKEDASHQLEYARLLVNGTQWVAATEFQHLLQPGVAFLPKKSCHPMELADLVAREIFEWVGSDCAQRSNMWNMLSAKIYRRDDRLRGKFGVKIFPDSDIREQIVAHRQNRGN